MLGRAVVLVLAVVVAGSAACGGAQPATRPAAGSTTPTASPGTSPPATIQLVPPRVKPVEIGSSGLPAPSGVTASRASAPVRIRIPAIGVDSSLLQLDTKEDGTIEVPSDPDKAGWYSRGPAPGEQGPAIILGHLDSHTGPAIFWRLSTLHPGDEVWVNREDGSELDFKVRRIATFSTSSFPTSEVYNPTAGPELRLITCGGTFSLTRRQYSANVVAFATLAG